jgi:hypothetical protein
MTTSSSDIAQDQEDVEAPQTAPPHPRDCPLGRFHQVLVIGATHDTMDPEHMPATSRSNHRRSSLISGFGVRDPGVPARVLGGLYAVPAVVIGWVNARGGSSRRSSTDIEEHKTRRTR